MKPDLSDEEIEVMNREAARSGNWGLGLIVFMILVVIGCAISTCS
jgi:hypothetical protein